jgi:hypothetical protein
VAVSVYERLAEAMQAVAVEKEASEEARADKIRKALQTTGHMQHAQTIIEALRGPDRHGGR